jgi:spore photoproduct lyase
VKEAKRRLVIADRRGGFVKEFPSGRGLGPSDWQYFIPAIGCPADCRYCFLQAYHPAGAPVVFAETHRLFDEIRSESERLKGGYFYGGELCDSLMLEPFSALVPALLDLFRSLPDATLELRTKSAGVEPLLNADAPPNIIVSWTFSPREIVRRFEAGTASATERIEAARRVQKAGYKIGIRLDPVVLTDGWLSQYKVLVAGLAESLDPALVESVHLGCLRFTPALKAVVQARYGESAPFDGEFVMGPDGKMRYPRPLRATAYSTLKGLLSRWSGDFPVWLCMETPQMMSDVCAC